jgi:hypothetical protein
VDSIKGAQILAEVLEQRGNAPLPAPAALLDRSALPLFHWLGVEPAGAPADPDAG